jgi:beta-galactosidase
MWTGFDYRGEPNPFYQRNVVSSFGTIDLCGMEKPPFYYYKAWWTDEPVLKLSPSWNHNEGEKVTVSAYTNCERIKLTLNGRIVAEQVINKFDAPVFELDFEPGVLVAEGEHFLIGHDAPEHGVRLALGGIQDREGLREALSRIAYLLESRP